MPPNSHGLPIKFEPEYEADVHMLQSSSSSDQSHMLQHLRRVSSGGLEELGLPVPLAPSATPVRIKLEHPSPVPYAQHTLTRSPGTTLDMDRHMVELGSDEATDFLPLMPVKDEPLSEGEQQQYSGEDTNDSTSGLGADGSSTCSTRSASTSSPKNWTQQDMDHALDALRTHNMSLTKASATYGIPSTTLWQRAHRLGIDTPKKEGTSKSWSEADLHNALHALRTGSISANKASKAYGIPSSTLYKIARREGIRLAAPFNAAPTAWRRADLERALHSIRSGVSSVQRASTQFGIPTGTLYGRCKREGIELSRSNPTPWSEDAMGEALEAVRVGQMSINQAAIHYNLPYSSLYGRFKRCKYHVQGHQALPQQLGSQMPEGIETEQLPTPDMYTHYQAMPPHMPHSHHVPHHEHQLSHAPATPGHQATALVPHHSMPPLDTSMHLDPTLHGQEHLHHQSLHDHGQSHHLYYAPHQMASHHGVQNGIATS